LLGSSDNFHSPCQTISKSQHQNCMFIKFATFQKKKKYTSFCLQSVALTPVPLEMVHKMNWHICLEICGIRT
jgi:hypothetical protein